MAKGKNKSKSSKKAVKPAEITIDEFNKLDKHKKGSSSGGKTGISADSMVDTLIEHYSDGKPVSAWQLAEQITGKKFVKKVKNDDGDTIKVADPDKAKKACRAFVASYNGLYDDDGNIKAEYGNKIADNTDFELVGRKKPKNNNLGYAGWYFKLL